MARRWWTALVLTCVGVLLGIVMGAWPLRSSEGLPTPDIEEEALEAWRMQLDEVVGRPIFARSRVGVEVMDCRSGAIVYERDGGQLLNPASNLKVLTAAAALETLGPAFRFKTSVLADGPLEEGEIAGNLYLRGEGDPLLVYEDVWKMVKDLQAQGLSVIKGDLVADDTYFDTVRTIPGWQEDEADDETHAYNAPLGALSFNFNTIALIVKPGEKVGAPVVITSETPTTYVRVTNRGVTGRANTANGIRFSHGSLDGRPELVVEGSLALNSGFKRYYRTVPDPPGFALGLFAEMLSREGIRVEGDLRQGKVPESAVALHYHYSEPLDIMLKYMNKLSSNFIAEQLVKAMGAKESGAPGSTEKGLKVLWGYVKKHDLPWEGARIYNGSGLAWKTAVSAHQLASVLCAVEQDFSMRYDYIATLPIAGVDGTMRNRMHGTPARGRVRAKTGSVAGVFGFSGFLTDREGRLLAFSFLVNDIAGGVQDIKKSQDIWANLLVAGPPQPGDELGVPEERPAKGDRPGPIP